MTPASPVAPTDSISTRIARAQYSGMSYAQPHLPYQVIRHHDAHFTHSHGRLIAAPALSLRACAVVQSPHLSAHLGLGRID